MRFWALLLASVSLFALPGSNPSSPRILQKGFFIPESSPVSVRVGYEGDFVFDAELKGVDRSSQTVNGGTFTFNIMDRFDAFAVLGASSLSLKWRFSNELDQVQAAQIDTSNAFLWAVGGRLFLWEWGNWGTGLLGRFTKADHPVSWLTIDGENGSTSSVHVDLRSWELNLGVSYHIDLFTPYLALNYLNTKARVDFPSSDFRNEHPIGLNLGCTLSTGSYFFLNVEARVISEEAVTLSGDFRF
jgi:hypothetical protein